MNRSDIGHTIADIRKARGLSLKAIGESTEIDYSYLSKIEKGQINVSIDNLLKILDALGASMTINTKKR